MVGPMGIGPPLYHDWGTKNMWQCNGYLWAPQEVITTKMWPKLGGGVSEKGKIWALRRKHVAHSRMVWWDFTRTDPETCVSSPHPPPVPPLPLTMR